MRAPSFVVEPFDARVVVCETRAQLESEMKLLGIEIESHEAAGAGATVEVFVPGAALHVIGVFNGALDTLVHECSHAVDMILKRKGVDEVHTELRAYLMGYMVMQVAARLKKMRWPKKR